MIKKLLLLMGLVLLTTSMASAALVNADQTITVGGQERVYKLYVPDNFATTADPVLIFSLHGAGNSRDGGRPDFNAVADEKGCVVVYPQGLTQNFYLAGMNATGWDASGESNSDLDFFKAIIEQVADNYTQQGKTLNRKRIYCCGFSNGGMMTYSNSNTASDIFAAFASISGFPVNEFHLRHTGTRPVPFLHIHGGADNFVNVDWYPTVRDIMVARNGCNPVPTTTTDAAKSYTKYEYAASEGGFPYIYYNVAAMGHSDNCTIDGKSSSMVMYEFMTQYTLDSECDKTLKWKEQVDYSDYYPMNHGWEVVNSSTLSYGTSQAANNADHNVYHDIQLEAGSYELRVKTSGTAGDKMTFKLETVGGTEVLNKEVTVGTDANLAFTTTAYAQYKLTFTKNVTDDKITSVAIHSTSAAQSGITLGTELKWDEVKDGKTPFILVQNGYAMCKTGDDLLVVKPEEITSADAYVFKVEEGTGTLAGNYFFHLYDKNGTSVNYVNASVWSHAFLSGKNSNNGEYQNGLLWTVAAMTGGYSIRNLGVSQGYYDVNTDGTASTESKKSQGYLTANLNPNDYWKWHPQWTKSEASAWKFYSTDSGSDSGSGSGSGSTDAPREDFVFSGYDKNSGYTLRPIRQYGKDLVYADDVNETVTLHGVMDTPNAYFNNNRWAITDWNSRYDNDGDVANCLAYFETLLSAFTDHQAGSYVDLFRLHLDPAWTNDPAKTATNGGQENDISRFSADRLRTYMEKLYWPIAKKAIDKGMYVIMRPPGVCPQTIQVGGEYQEYLKTVWDIVSSDENVQQYAGMIMLELANEPINVLDTDGTNSNARKSVLHDFFQPIVDVIRANGFKGIVLSSGSGYQWHYEGYADYPITGDNIGYAVHWYPGWHGTKSDATDIADQTVIAEFQKDVPVVTSRPIVITEVDWSPQDVSAGIDHYNEFGQPVYKNYGTWASGLTSRFGRNFKATHDYFGNISMTLTHPYEYVDFDQLFKYGKVTYSYRNRLTPKEACAAYCFSDWYPAVYTDHTPNGTSPKNAPYVEEYYADDASRGIADLTSSIFYLWGTDSEGNVTTSSGNGACVTGQSTDLPYGLSTVASTCYADLSGYSSLEVTVSSGEPRFMFNRAANDGDIVYEYPRDKEDKPYETVTNNGDGTTTYTIDLEAIVKEAGVAHLHAIKGANWQNVTVTSMKLNPIRMWLWATTPKEQTNQWDWQIRYPLPTTLEEGKQYTIELTAKASTDVHIQPIAAWNASTNKDQWGGTADVQYLSADLTTEMSTSTMQTNGNTPYDYLYFNIGKLDGDLIISHLRITDPKGTVVVNSNMSDASTWTKTQSLISLSVVSATTPALPLAPNDPKAVVYTAVNQLSGIDATKFGNGLSIDSHEWNCGRGVITFSNPVTKLDKGTFSNVADLTSISLPAQLQTVGSNAFDNCSNLSRVAFMSIPLVASNLPDNTVSTLALTDDSYVYTGTEQNSFPTLTANPTYTREMSNEWGTIVVPFGINYDADNGNYKLYRHIATSAKALTFTEYEYENEEEVIPAGTPLAIKAVGNMNEETGKYEVTLTGNDNSISTYINNDNEPVGGLQMKGTYSKLTNQTEVYFIADDQFWWAESPITINPFRAWFEGSLPSAKGASLRIEVAGETEGIELIENEDASHMLNGTCFDLQGRQIGERREGLQIKNGRVIMVK